MTEIAQGRYRLERQIASGSFGKVFADRQFAIKELKLPSSGIAKSRLSPTALLANEIRILTQLNHPNIVKVYEVIEEPAALYIVMELCQNDLSRYTQPGGCGERRSVQLIRQVLTGYRELARQGIVHRDLKPANILIGRGVAKLADFGMAKFVANEAFLLRSHVGTPYYMAPQVLQRIEYSRKCDIWSLGVILYQLVFGRMPWEGKSEATLLENIMTFPLRFPTPISTSLKDVLARMLAISENQRASLQEVEKLLELYEGEREAEERSFHWTLLRKMLLHEADHRSQLQFSRRYSELSEDGRREVDKELKSLLREDEQYTLQYLALWREK